MIHIKTPKKRGARISGLVMHTEVAQLICTFRIPQLDLEFVTLFTGALFFSFNLFQQKLTKRPKYLNI